MGHTAYMHSLRSYLFVFERGDVRGAGCKACSLASAPWKSRSGQPNHPRIPHHPANSTPPPNKKVISTIEALIVGAGVSGLSCGIRLREAGIAAQIGTRHAGTQHLECGCGGCGTPTRPTPSTGDRLGAHDVR